MEVQGLDGLKADLAAAAATVDTEASVVVRKTAHDIEADAKRNAPFDTGHLRGSIGVDPEHPALWAEVGPTADYGLWVETGTSKMAPQPYLFPAARKHEEPFQQAMAEIGADV